MRKTLAVFIAVAILAGALPAFAGGATDPAPIYKAKCAMCHGPDGKKENKAMNIKPLTSPDVQKKTDDELFAITSNGKGKMPAYKGKLSDDEIRSVVVHIRDLAKK